MTTLAHLFLWGIAALTVLFSVGCAAIRLCGLDRIDLQASLFKHTNFSFSIKGKSGVEGAQYNVKATGHVAKLRRDLSV